MELLERVAKEIYEGYTGLPWEAAEGDRLKEVSLKHAQDILEIIKTESQVVEMSLCEVPWVILRPNQLYRFVVIPGCEKCATAAKATTEKYFENTEVVK